MSDFNSAPLLLHSVIDRGQPNRERIALFAREDLSTSRYCLLIGVSVSENDAIPIPDNSLWLGSGSLRRGDWIFVYTGPGTPRTDPLNENKIYSIYWNRDKTVFFDSTIVPILIQTNDVWVSPPPHPTTSLPQFDTQKLTGPMHK